MGATANVLNVAIGAATTRATVDAKTAVIGAASTHQIAAASNAKHGVDGWGKSFPC